MGTLPRQHAIAELDQWLADHADSDVRAMMRHLSRIASPATGADYLEVVVEALDAMFGATSIFIAHRSSPESNQVSVLAARREGQPRALWEYSLDNNPCLLAYDGEPTYIPCDLADEFENKRDSGYQSFVGVPLVGSAGAVIGHIAMYDAEPLADEHLYTALVQAFAGRAASELERDVMERRLEQLANSDELTGLANRRGFSAVAEHAFESARRSATDLALVAFDLDAFKLVNDRYGHGAGDEALVVFARCLKDVFKRGIDLIARIGGDEFIVLVEKEEHTGATRLANLVRASFEAAKLPFGDDDVQCGCSYGVAVRDSADSEVEDLLRRADAALYESKAARAAHIVETA